MHTVIMQIILDGMYSQHIVDCFSFKTDQGKIHNMTVGITVKGNKLL